MKYFNFEYGTFEYDEITINSTPLIKGHFELNIEPRFPREFARPFWFYDLTKRLKKDNVISLGAYYPWRNFNNDKINIPYLKYPAFSNIAFNSKSGRLLKAPSERIKKGRIQQLGLISNFYSQYLKSIIEVLTYDELIPVPAKSEYSYNSVEIIGGEFSECFNIPLITDRLIRVNDDLKEYSIVRENDNLSQKKVLLVDDIITNSETKNNIIYKFYEKGCTNIDMITLARTDHTIYEYNE